MGCAVGLKALEILQRDNLPQASRQKGEYLLQAFEDLRQKYPHIIAEARGAGLMCALEFADPDLTPRTDIALKLVDLLRDRGFILLPSGPWGNVLSVAPPLIIPMDYLHAFVEALDDAIEAL